MFVRKPLTINSLRAILDTGLAADVGQMACVDLATGNFKPATAGVPTLVPFGTFTEKLVGDGTRQTVAQSFSELHAQEWLNDVISPVVMPAMRGSPVYMLDARTVTSNPAGGANAIAGVALDIDRGGRVITVPSLISSVAAGGTSVQQGPPYDPTSGAPMFLFPTISPSIANATSFINWDFSRVGKMVYLFGEILFDVTGAIAIGDNLFEFKLPPNLPLPVLGGVVGISAYDPAGDTFAVELAVLNPTTGIVVARTVPVVHTGYKAFFTMTLALESLA
jgi:hypothetical protein